MPHPRRRSLATMALVAIAGGLLPAISLSSPAAAAPDDDVWTPVARRAPQSEDGHARSVHPTAYRSFRLDGAAPTTVAIGPAAAITRAFTVDDTVPDVVTAQYSDPVDVAFSATTGPGDASVLTATPTGLPAGLALTRTSVPGGPPGTATFTVTGNVAAVPDSYPVSVAVTDGTAEATVDFTIEVAKEDGVVTYTGPTSVVAPRGGDDAVQVTLTATVAEGDATPGDLTLAAATFGDVTSQDLFCFAAPVTASGATSCTFGADLPHRGAGRTYAVGVELAGDYYTGQTDATTDLTISVDGLMVTDEVADTVSTQYGDPVDVTFSATTGVGEASLVTATPTGLPAGLSIARSGSAAGVLPSKATFSVAGNVTDEPGSYPVSIQVSDGTSTVPVDFTVVVSPEDASAVYGGPTEVVAPTGGNDATDVTVTALIGQDDDGTPGDLARAEATFTDAATDEVLCAGVPVTSGGLAGCTFSADLPASGSRTYEIDVTIGGDFVGSTDTAGDLTVAVETVAPQTKFTARPALGAILTTRSVSLAFSSTEPGSTFVCRLDRALKPCADGTAAYTGLGSGTHTFAVSAVDANGNADLTPVSVTWTVPRDDAALVRSGGSWTRVAASGAFDRTLTHASRKGATLATTVSGVRTLGIVAATSPAGGAVSVYLNGTFVARRSLLTSTASSQRVLPLIRFATPATGRVTLVTGSAKTVRIDGLAVVNG